MGVQFCFLFPLNLATLCEVGPELEALDGKVCRSWKDGAASGRAVSRRPDPLPSTPPGLLVAGPSPPCVWDSGRGHVRGCCWWPWCWAGISVILFSYSIHRESLSGGKFWRQTVLNSNPILLLTSFMICGKLLKLLEPLFSQRRTARRKDGGPGIPWQVEPSHQSCTWTPDSYIVISCNTGDNKPKLTQLLWGLPEMMFEKPLAECLVPRKQPRNESDPPGSRD